MEKSGQMAKQHTSHDPPSSDGTEPGGCSAPVDFGFSKAVSGKLSAPIYRSAFQKQVTGSPSFSSASPEQLDELCEGDMKIKFGLHCSSRNTRGNVFLNLTFCLERSVTCDPLSTWNPGEEIRAVSFNI